MKTWTGIFVCLLLGTTAAAQWSNADSSRFDAVFEEALGNGECHERLRELTKGIGHRLSGSPEADAAMAWGADVLAENGADSVYVMPVVVPSWTRGDHCSASYDGIAMRVTALGGYDPTPNDAVLTAPCVVVKGIEELAELPSEQTEGRIVLFNRPQPSDTILELMLPQ